MAEAWPRRTDRSLVIGGSCRGAHPRRPRSTHPPVGVTLRFSSARTLCAGGRLQPVGSSPLSGDPLLGFVQWVMATGDPLATPPAGARHEDRVVVLESRRQR